MNCYAVIDTNVLVSALLSSHEDAATVQVMVRLLSGEIVPVFSEAILTEYRQVLRRTKFGFDKATVDFLLSAIERFGLCVEPQPSGLTLPDMKDLPFYEVALENGVGDTRLVTGNIKHYPREPFVVTPRRMLEILDQNH